MNERQIDHLQYILNTLTEWVHKKYEKGALEHGGNLLDMTPEQLIDEAINENIDQITYLLTLRKKLQLPRQ